MSTLDRFAKEIKEILAFGLFPHREVYRVIDYLVEIRATKINVTNNDIITFEFNHNGYHYNVKFAELIPAGGDDCSFRIEKIHSSVTKI